MNNSLLYNVLIRPHVTEKSVTMTDKLNHLVFEVMPSASKDHIKAAVKKLFNVDVLSVRTINRKSKVKRFKNRVGKRRSVKLAVIQLPKGQDINLAEFK